MLLRYLKSYICNSVAELRNNYVIDGCEQDIIVLWNGHMFVIEAKAYTNREPFRNADKAFTRIKDDFNSCIGYAYKQCKRIENKMKAGKPFDLLDKNGNVIKTINPADYDGNDFYIIVNQESFGHLQTVTWSSTGTQTSIDIIIPNGPHLVNRG